MHKLWVMAVLCGTVPALAWGPAGHSLVARIAEAQLNPAAKARVAEILGPNDSMASVSSWADQVRRQRANTGPWHYVDIPIDQPHLDMARDCAQGACVIAQIEAEEGVLRDPARPAAERRESLMFLIHFVADMHQPLHSSDHKDKGGNDVHVVFFDRPGNLHSVWDTGLLSRMGKEEDLYPVLLEDARKHYKKWSKGTVEDWAEQAHKDSKQVVYGKLPAAAAGTNATLGADYEKLADPLIRRQLEKAGDRLARILNETLQ